MDAATDTERPAGRPAVACACASAGGAAAHERLRAAADAVGGAVVAGLDAEEALSAVLAARHASAAAFAVELEALDRLAAVYPEIEARA
ncbi:MAG TPA: hypothetical protein VK894_10545, partial [Jiangellales bacterium]|nr:hypothetical protein [Jiangellales bacterium]